MTTHSNIESTVDAHISLANIFFDSEEFSQFNYIKDQKEYTLFVLCHDLKEENSNKYFRVYNANDPTMNHEHLMKIN